MAGPKAKSIWRERLDAILEKSLQLITVAMIYLASELLIWGISRLLANVNCEFFSSIVGMAIVFALVSALYTQLPLIDALYRSHVKPLVDWINGQMGVGFVIPLIMLDPAEILSSAEIGEIIGNFVLTNIVFWPLTYYAALYSFTAVMYVVDDIKAGRLAKKNAGAAQRPLQAPGPANSTTDIELTLPAPPPANTTFTLVKKDDEPSDTSSPDGTGESSSSASSKYRFVNWQAIALQYPSILSIFLLFALGAPIAAATGDSRTLDGFATWFFWISAVRGQRLFKQSRFFPQNPRYKSVIATLLNPVLMTVLWMLAYTRAKAAAMGVEVSWVLDEYSKGSPLYELWTAGVNNDAPHLNPTAYFGAGDLALSILEVGILIWGFKLYECRRQLFSTAGIVTVLISIAAAATNVYLSVLLGVTLKLDAAEALAFAARSTTLALAKPAIEAVGGNVPANAGLVVANGILGQLLYPFSLSRLGVKREGDLKGKKKTTEQKALLEQNTAYEPGSETPPLTPIAEPEEADDAITIAAGIAIGINGAAMGVAYLVEQKSRAAPYAALAMTIFGVFTVVFTTVEPFTNAAIGLANLEIHA